MKYFVLLELYFVVQGSTGVVVCSLSWYWSSIL